MVWAMGSWCYHDISWDRLVYSSLCLLLQLCCNTCSQDSNFTVSIAFVTGLLKLILKRPPKCSVHYVRDMKIIFFCFGARFEPHCTPLARGPYDVPALVLCAQAPVLTICNTEQDRQGTCDINIEMRSCNHCCSGKTIS